MWLFKVNLDTNRNKNKRGTTYVTRELFTARVLL